MKNKFILPLVALLSITLSACGKKGDTGPQGEQGVPGQNGKDGKDGVDGKDGTSIITGKGAPETTLGNDGDSYIDVDTWNYYVKENGSWVLKGNIKGSDGQNGQKGEDGEDGISVTSIVKTSSNENVDTYTITYSDGTTSTFTVTNGVDGAQGIQGVKGDDGHTPEITIGTNGNWFIDGVDSGIKAQGPQGDHGQDGTNGIDGQDGTSMLSGNSEPASTIGKDGDSYIDTTTWNYYVKENGSWVLKGNIKGSNGQDAVQYIPAIFNNFDGSMLYTFYYEKGSTIVYDGPEPTRDGYIQDGDHYIYEFTGWDKSLENIQVPTIFTAQYESRNVTKEYNLAHGILPNLSQDGKTLTYGLYPQTVVDDADLLIELDALTTPESNGYYLFEDEYYAKTIAFPDNDSYFPAYKFDNGTIITSGETYWFKCEPITWNVLSNNDGEYYLLSSLLLDAHCYHNSTSNRTIEAKTVYPNNYEYSDIRNWLNNDFYNTAFAFGNAYIQTTTVDNSAATTDSSSNPYACNNTQDNVFLPSYQDYINVDYGFSGNGGSYSETRRCKTTDWARAKGAFSYNGSTPVTNYGIYMTRSPYSDSTLTVSEATHGGNLDHDNVDRMNHSVRPAITIRIANV